MFAGLLSGFQSLLAQPAMLAIGAGLLAGAVTGTGLVATGVFPFRPQPRLTLVSCYDNGVAIGTVGAGQSLLVTARSSDGSWLELYLGLPEADRGWAPASAVRFSAAIDSLPVAECVGYIPPASGAPGSPPPTIEPSIPPSSEPSLVATVEPSVAPSSSPTAAPTPTPRVTPTPKPTPKPTATPLPPPPTIPPTPTPVPSADVFPPSVLAPYITSPGPGNGGSYFIGHPPCAPSSATIRVAANDPSGLNWVRLWYAKPQGGGTSYITMSFVSAGVYQATIAPDNSWLDGEIGLWSQAQDALGNTSGYEPFNNPYNSSDVSLFWSSICIT